MTRKRYPAMNAVVTEADGAVLTPEMLERARQAMRRGAHRSRLEMPVPIRRWLEESAKKVSEKK